MYSLKVTLEFERVLASQHNLDFFSHFLNNSSYQISNAFRAEKSETSICFVQIEALR